MATFTATSADTSVAKPVQVSCPTDLKVVGGGAGLDGGLGDVYIDRIVPDAGLSTVTAHAVEDLDGTTQNWRLSAFVVCAAPPAGLELRRGSLTVPDGHNTTATTVATCSPGKKALGSFGEVVGGGSATIMNRLAPLSTLNGTEFGATTASGTSPGHDWTVAAYAVCATP
jgi:hypothetical protein